MSKKNNYSEMFETAKKLVKSDNKEKGRDLLLELVLLDTPFKQNALFELGKMYLYEKNYKASKECFKKIINENGKNKIYAILELGRIYTIEKNYKEAKECFKQLLITPKKDYAKYELGKIAEIEKDNETAKYYYEQVLDNEFTILALARIYSNEEETEKAKYYYEMLIKNNNKNKIFALFEVAKIYSAEGDKLTAKTYYEKLIKMNANNKIPAILELSKLYATEGENEIAKSYLNQILNTPYKKYAEQEIARIEAKTGNEEYVRKLYIDAISDEDNTYVILNLIYIDIKIGYFEEALELLKILPDNKYYSNIETYLLYQTGKKDEIRVYNYFTKQLLDFSDDKTLEHIKRHFDEKEGKKKHTKFDNGIDIEKTYEFVKEKIQYMDPIDYLLVEKYIIKCEQEIATIGNKRVRYIEAITLPHSKKILTIYPTSLIKDQEKTKILKL